MKLCVPAPHKCQALPLQVGTLELTMQDLLGSFWNMKYSPTTTIRVVLRLNTLQVGTGS